jgi:hypothetical protein
MARILTGPWVAEESWEPLAAAPLAAILGQNRAKA